MAEKLQQSPVTIDSSVKSTQGLYENVALQSEQLGIYRVVVATAKDKKRQYLNELRDMRDATPHILRLFRDIYALAPSLFIYVVLAQIWSGLEDAILVHLSTRLLRAIEYGLTSGKPFAKEVLRALVSRLLFTALVAYGNWLGQKLRERLMGLVSSHFDMYLMKVKLGIDVPASLDASSQIDVIGSDAWSAFEQVLRYLRCMLTILSQIVVIYRESQSSGDPTFLIACLAEPIFSNISVKSLWNKEGYAFVNNEDYKRMEALKNLAGGSYREDVLSYGLAPWILKEYQAARDRLGDTPQRHPYLQYYESQSPIKRILQPMLGELPMVYCGLNAILRPSSFSIANIAIYQATSSHLQVALAVLLSHNQEFWKGVNNVKQIYSTKDIRNKVVGGELPYPPPGEKSDQGMAFELRNVSFSYPGSHNTNSALQNVNFTIPSGSVVVIVGANGSGKSTLIRLLARLFDPSSGEFFIDGEQAKNYSMTDLRRASTILSQDNKVYPLSFAENIGLGCLQSFDDTELIKKAAEQGGATEFISKLDMGFDSRLDNSSDTVVINLYGKNDHPLQKEMEKLPKATNISGGERQRLVAARSFMRFNSGKVKFVAVDEPSSALDAEGELQLFNRLLEVKDGKTMVFVTHRFGHLTNHADIIICMKDGKIVELGTHDALISQAGEYAKLYNIQADAFAKGRDSSDV